jgi:alpha-glucosidase
MPTGRHILQQEGSALEPQTQHDPDAWWRHGVVYQVYPRSFQDSNGDGIGDLGGIRQRLPYLKDLGVDAVWISPIYPSPMADFGYDVADYCDVDPIFGSLDDFDALLQDAHRQGMKVILDFVPNHTSDRHPWFLASRSSRDNAFRDFYLWRDAAPDGGPPNNWRSNFGGPAWSFDEPTGQWYYHAFLPQQPDLNWRNPEVRQRMFDALRFWLARGVDGFRVDVIWHLIKDDQFRDNPPDPAWRPDMAQSKSVLQVYSADRPELMEVVAEMRAVMAEFDTPTSSRILIGEIYLPIERLVAFYAPDDTGTLRGVQLPFNFHLISTHWEAAALAELIRRYEAAIPARGWPNWVLGNHDQPRIASRVGEARAALAACLLLTLRGTPTLYYGDEIGMTDVAIPAAALQDPAELREPGKGQGRDPQRTPMQWDAGAGAGFTRGVPWLPLAPDHAERNVERMQRDPHSILALYRTLLALRRSERALHGGSIESVAAIGDCLVFDRVGGDSRLRIQINFGAKTVALPAGQGEHPVIFDSADFAAPVSTAADRSPGRTGEPAGDLLPPLVARVLRVAAGR